MEKDPVIADLNRYLDSLEEDFVDELEKKQRRDDYLADQNDSVFACSTRRRIDSLDAIRGLNQPPPSYCLKLLRRLNPISGLKLSSTTK